MKASHHEKITQHQLANGLQIVYERSESPVVYCGYVVKAGTCNEESADTGMAHFLEHISFKGTSHRKAFQINRYIDAVGGDLNAYTTKQDTVYTISILKDHFARAVELLTDIVFFSTYPQREIDREVEVICDEIESYQDTPAELIFDDFERLLFNGHAMGRDILGTPERLREYTTADAMRFAEKFYCPDNCVFFVLGNIDFPLLVKRLERLTQPVLRRCSGKTGEIGKVSDEMALFREHHLKKGTHQSHVVAGSYLQDEHTVKRSAAMLLSNLLGGPAMSSRFNQLLREKAGLVYSVDSYLTRYRDILVWSVYFGCDTHDVPRCLQIIRREIRKMAAAPLSDVQLRAAKRQLIGQMALSLEQREGYAVSLGRSMAHYGKIRDIDEEMQAINALTATDVQHAAQSFFDESRLLTLIYD